MVGQPVLFGSECVTALGKGTEDRAGLRRQIGPPVPVRVRFDMTGPRDLDSA